MHARADASKYDATVLRLDGDSVPILHDNVPVGGRLLGGLGILKEVSVAQTM